MTPYAPVPPHTPAAARSCTGGHGAGDEEGPVSWGRELTLQGVGKSWVGVLPSSDLGVAGGGKADAETWGERFLVPGRMGWEAAAAAGALLLNPSPSC